MKQAGKLGYVLIGFILGAVICGGSFAVAAGILANPSADKVVSNGKEITCEVYKIGGNNYFKLRDIAAAVDFSVVYDGQGGRVLIDTLKPYDPSEQYVAPTEATPSPCDAPTMTIEEMRNEIVRLTNTERTKAGLPELSVSDTLMNCAQAKAQDFEDNHYYGHNSPVYGTPGEMIRSFVSGVTAAGENIAPWRETATDAFLSWLESPPHYENILNPKFTHIGVGIIGGADGGYWFVAQYAQIR